MRDALLLDATSALLAITPWVDVMNAEYNVTVYHGRWVGHLLIQLPRVDIRETGGNGGQDFLGSLARAILSHRSA